jgi:hypothetical protein
MSILGSIMSSVLGSRAQAAPPPPVTTATAETRHASAAPVASTAPTPAPQQQPPAQVDVAAVLDKLAKEAGEKLDWRRSIVDLMKLVKLDSGLAARKTLAKELSYTGDTKDSATMNMWLHKQVMAKLAQNGGKLPDDLKPDAPETRH